uniref:Uncharacterized protein n=1 Tax=Panagrolaimus davidi TaxID=227884 RepID=A0A914QUU0_9BILA
MPTKRRQTEPAVFAVNKNNKKRENGIVEEEMERIDEENNYDEQDYEITSERNRTGLGLNTTVVSGTCPTLEPLLEKKNGVQKETDEPPNNRGNWFRRSKKWLFREASASTQKDLSSKSVPSFKENRKINGTIVVHSSDFPGGVSSNSISACSVGGSAPVSVANGGINITEKPSSGSHCSVKVYCVTNEANV